MAIKAVVFDVGDVVLREHGWEARKVLADKFGFSEEGFGEYANEKLKLSYLGKFTAEEFFGGLKEKLEIDASAQDLIQAWIDVRLETTRFDEGVVEIIKGLRGKYFLASLTDTTVLNDVVRKRVGVYDLFDLNVVSTEVGVRKPDEGIYEFLLSKLAEKGIGKDEVVFVDDERVNLEGALRVGIRGVLFGDVEGLRVSLREVGVEV